MNLFSPTGFPDYELIDTGGREKLERFGKYILIRPEPQAVWRKALTEKEWDRMADATFTRGKIHQSPVTSHQPPVPGHSQKDTKGTWNTKPGMPDRWWIEYRYKEMHLKFRLGLTSFGHIGVFPEQADNWIFIYDRIMAMKDEGRRTRDEEVDPGSGIRILNLFAYTGGASLAARAAGSDVVHVDSVKQVLSWAREDMEASGLDGIRWVAEDALKFVRREVKRGNRYDGIILDPPAYGRGPEGEKWVLEEYIDELAGHCAELLIPHSTFLILSLYSMAFSPLIGENLIKTHFGDDRRIQTGELYFPDRSGRKLPLGTFTRFW